MQGKRNEARAQYEQALQIDQNSAVAANNLASLYADTGERLDAALQLAQTAVRQMPDNASAADTLGWVFYKQGQAKLATAPFERATEREPSNPVFHYHLGLAHVKTGDKVRARASLERALQLNPNFPEAQDAKRALAGL